MSRRLLLLATLSLAACSRDPPTARPLPSVESAAPKAIPSSAPTPLPSASAQPACIDVDADARIELTGIVASGTHSHPNGTVFPFFLLRLDQPRCAKGIEDATVDELQLVSPDAIDLKPFVDKHVHVIGTAMAGMTAWYVRPAALDVTSIEIR